MYATEMDSITGLTFFFISSRLRSLHVHHSGEPSAQNTFDQSFPNRPRSMAVWIHLPVAKRDRVLLIGIREGPERWCRCIVVRTELAGDVSIGEATDGPFRDYVLGASAPLTLIHGDPKPSIPVRFLGVYCRISADPAGDLPQPPRLPLPSKNPIGEDAYLSWAPLGGVSSVEVFYDESDGTCRGILLHYQHGGARSLGQRRIHVDPTRIVMGPARVCFKLESKPARYNGVALKAHVKFQETFLTDGGNGELGDGSWKSHKMEGIIKFWFTWESCFIEVEN